ncbi:hypothetical protein B0H17DRAFT_1135927 [Mycena rosella]|uniref:Uncharacterized protein n=1 Tax=Mycena rosella TaxID=1033263 RepID=A0AAD7GEZ2_MYCRO|nr:hypothetical protein B0H17DRAFT_1135927 [Mycena rosella]
MNGARKIIYQSINVAPPREIIAHSTGWLKARPVTTSSGCTCAECTNPSRRPSSVDGRDPSVGPAGNSLGQTESPSDVSSGERENCSHSGYNTWNVTDGNGTCRATHQRTELWAHFTVTTCLVNLCFSQKYFLGVTAATTQIYIVIPAIFNILGGHPLRIALKFIVSKISMIQESITISAAVLSHECAGRPGASVLGLKADIWVPGIEYA